MRSRKYIPNAPRPEDYEHVLVVSCDTCAAAVGEPCRRPRSVVMGVSGLDHIPHSSRIAKWANMGRPTRQTAPQGQQQSWHETEEDWRA